MTTDSPTSLRDRRGSRPRTTSTHPHVQLEQNAPPVLQERLWARVLELPGVHEGPSGISLPDSRAAHLDATAALGPPDAFLQGHEFAHRHPTRDGSLHVALPSPLAREIADRGWGEAHPLAATGELPDTYVMLYGPRDDADLDVVWALLRRSYAFATGTDEL